MNQYNFNSSRKCTLKAKYSKDFSPPWVPKHPKPLQGLKQSGAHHHSTIPAPSQNYYWSYKKPLKVNIATSAANILSQCQVLLVMLTNADVVRLLPL